MRRNGCLLSFIAVFIGFLSLYAANVLDDDKLKTPDYYEVTVRGLFKQGKWAEGKTLLDQGLLKYPDVTGLNELNGQYYYQYKNYDDARYYLILSIRDNPDNVRAKQLLIKVEEETKNYSSAICYVNELLEINPYWRGLWRKKIGLYRLQGNDVEADRLLKRLYQIYPNDTAVARQYAYGLEEIFYRRYKEQDKQGSIEALRELVQVMPDSAFFYLTLSNLLLQQGNTTEALEVTARGASRLPGSTELIIKRAGILAGEGRYPEALSYVKERMRFNRSGRLAGFYNGLLAEAANAARMNDPYTLYGQVYERTKNSEALDYMVNTALLRRYDEDALYYINEAKKKRGETPALLYKEYVVYRRMGNQGKAYNTLSTLHEMNPADAEIANELALLRLQEADRLMADRFYAEALPYADFAARKAHDPEIKASAWNKVYACNYELRRYDNAVAALDSLHASSPGAPSYLVKLTDTYQKQGRGNEALRMLETAMQDTTQREMHALYASAYEETAIPYIKGLIDKGASYKALQESDRLLQVNPSSKEGLTWAINMSALLGRHDDFDRYTASARNIYPEETDFIVKQASSYIRKKEFQRGIDLIRPELDTYPDNAGLVGAFAESSEGRTYQLLKEHEPEEALAVADTALFFDEDNPSLFLAKGTAHEALKQYDSAFVYQSKYKPAPGEAKSHQRHLDGLQSRSYKNEVFLEYMQGRYGEADILTSVATAAYTRKLKRDNVTGRIYYAGRDGSAAGEDPTDQVPGGVGVQLQGEWEHHFSRKWSVMANAAWASRYFPQLSATAKVTYTTDKEVEWDLHASYRKIRLYDKTFAWEQPEDDPAAEGFWVFDHWNERKHNLYSAGLGLAKTWDNFRVSGKVDGYILNKKLYANAATTVKFFPLTDGRTNVYATGSIGSAPEAGLLEYAMPGTFNKLNTMVGLGGSYMFNKHISVGLLGTWSTFYNQVNAREGDLYNFRDYVETDYRNLYNIYVQLQIHF